MAEKVPGASAGSLQLTAAVVMRVPEKVVLVGGAQPVGWLPAGASRPLAEPVRSLRFSFEIQFDGSGYLLCYESEDGGVCSDSWHETLEEAKRAAGEDFGVLDEEWMVRAVS